MKNTKLFLLVSLIAFCTYIACHKGNGPVSYGPRVDVEFAGLVLDENGQPVVNALVQTDGVAGVTDSHGIFRLKSANLPEQNAILRVKGPGFYDFSRAFIVKDKSIQNVTIHLIRKNKYYTFNADNGSDIDLEGKMGLSFPAGAFVTENGAAFHGTAYVYAKPLSADDPDLRYKMPGDLRGINAAGEEGVLNTFGMMAVEIEDANGNTLKIATDRSVTLRMNIPDGKKSVAPETIALWYFDQEEARWKEEGSAQKLNGQYVGEVKHFSFWNCDDFMDLIILQGKVFLGSTDHPISNAEIKLTVTSNGMEGYAGTNTEGEFGGSVPRDEAMTLEVLIPNVCGTVQAYTQQVGPFNADVTLPDIIIPLGNVNISGNLQDCNGQAIPDGFAILSTSSGNLPIFANPDGSFNLTLPECTNGISANLTGYNPGALTSSNELTFTLNTSNNLGNIQVCQALDSYIQYTLDGQSYTKVDPIVHVYSTQTQIFSQPADSSATSPSIYFAFQPATAPGDYLLENLYFNYNIFYDSNETIPPLSTNVTTYGQVIGEYVIGSFSGTFIATGGTGATHTVSCNYRVKIK